MSRDSASSLSRTFRRLGVIFAAVGLAVVWIGPVSTKVEHHVVPGIAVFAVLYVIAQGVERIVEIVTSLLGLIKNSPGKEKEEALRAIAAANSTLNGNPSIADFSASAPKAAKAKANAKKKVDNARTDLSFLALGLSILLCAIAVNALNYGILASLGTTHVNGDLDRLFTALAAAGGSKGVHELVGRLQKGKEAAEATAKST